MATGRNRASPVSAISQRVLASGARLASRKAITLTVEGAEYLPQHGPLLIAARHYHHLYDGCALVRSTRRPLHILVALDWVTSSTKRALMERACHMAGWPVVLREDGLARSGHSAYQTDEVRRYLRSALRKSVELLRSGQALVVFPEGYPNIDPAFTPKRGDDFLPFRPGFLRIAELAQRSGSAAVPIVPAGFEYVPEGSGWRVTLRYGAPLVLDGPLHRAEVAARIEAQVHTLSGVMQAGADAVAPVLAGIDSKHALTLAQSAANWR